LEISIFPKPFEISGVNVGLSVVVAWFVLLVLIVLLVFARLAVRRFAEVPKGTQNFLELVVQSVTDFAESSVGHYAYFVAPVTLTFMTYIVGTTFVELFGIPPSTEDINCTIALGLCSLIMVFVTAFRFKGVRGTVKSLAKPSAVVFPVKVLTLFITPFSLGIRLFANVLVGGVIMSLLYSVIPLVVPAIVASYFNVAHVLIQTFVFGLLSLIYISEAVE
jgi:F-type H+-transporting ATPase subunit a